jgi:hypothetical protein
MRHTLFYEKMNASRIVFAIKVGLKILSQQNF